MLYNINKTVLNINIKLLNINIKLLNIKISFELCNVLHAINACLCQYVYFRMSK